MNKDFRFICLFCLVAINFSCFNTKPTPDKDVEAALMQFLSKNESDTFLLDSIVGFEWDEIYIIKPYLPDEDYLELRNKLKNLPVEIMPVLADWINYLLFVKDNKVIKYIEVPRAPCCDFATINPDENPTSFRRGAVLYKERLGNEIRIKIAKPK